MTPYYDHGGITIYHGDCREVLPLLGTFDLLLTDPPYDFGHYATDVAPAIALIMQSAPVAALWGYPELLCKWCIDIGRAPTEWITWWPTNAAAKAGGRHGLLPRQVEAIAIFGETLYPDRVKAPRVMTAGTHHGLSADVRCADVWRDASPGIGFNSHQRRHPNEKPESVMHRLLDFCAAPGASVVDPYMGSGPMAKACKDRGLIYVGIGLDERYCEIAANRLRQEVLFGAEAHQ